MAGRQRANGEGSIRERYPGCWEGRYTAGSDILTGKRIQKGVFAKTRKECAAKLARAIQQDTGLIIARAKDMIHNPFLHGFDFGLIPTQSQIFAPAQQMVIGA